MCLCRLFRVGKRLPDNVPTLRGQPDSVRYQIDPSLLKKAISRRRGRSVDRLPPPIPAAAPATVPRAR